MSWGNPLPPPRLHLDSGLPSLYCLLARPIHRGALFRLQLKALESVFRLLSLLPVRPDSIRIRPYPAALSASTSTGSSQVVQHLVMTASVSNWVIVSPHSIFTSVQSDAY